MKNHLYVLMNFKSEIYWSVAWGLFTYAIYTEETQNIIKHSRIYCKLTVKEGNKMKLEYSYGCFPFKCHTFDLFAFYLCIKMLFELNV